MLAEIGRHYYTHTERDWIQSNITVFQFTIHISNSNYSGVYEGQQAIESKTRLALLCWKGELNEKAKQTSDTSILTMNTQHTRFSKRIILFFPVITRACVWSDRQGLTDLWGGEGKEDGYRAPGSWHEGNQWQPVSGRRQGKTPGMRPKWHPIACIMHY